MIWNSPTDRKYPGVTKFAEQIKLALLSAHDSIIEARVKQTRNVNCRRQPSRFGKGSWFTFLHRTTSLPRAWPVGKDAVFLLEWGTGDCTWLPYRDVQILDALQDYFEVLGIKSIDQLCGPRHKDLEIPLSVNLIEPALDTLAVEWAWNDEFRMSLEQKGKGQSVLKELGESVSSLQRITARFHHSCPDLNPPCTPLCTAHSHPLLDPPTDSTPAILSTENHSCHQNMTTSDGLKMVSWHLFTITQ
jgi:hypothetical protein